MFKIFELILLALANKITNEMCYLDKEQYPELCQKHLFFYLIDDENWEYRHNRRITFDPLDFTGIPKEKRLETRQALISYFVIHWPMFKTSYSDEKYRYTALHVACSNLNRSMIKFLINLGFKDTEKNNMGVNALYKYVQSKHFHHEDWTMNDVNLIEELIIRTKSDVDSHSSCTSGGTVIQEVLHVYQKYSSAEVLENLLSLILPRMKDVNHRHMGFESTAFMVFIIWWRKRFNYVEFVRICEIFLKFGSKFDDERWNQRSNLSNKSTVRNDDEHLKLRYIQTLIQQKSSAEETIPVPVSTPKKWSDLFR